MTGQPLPLVSQLDYTDGLCAPFALAARDITGGRIELLYAADPRQLRLQDWPIGVPLCLHAYVALPSGEVVDAEGRRSAEEMRKSFGIRRGWSYRIAVDEGASLLAQEFRRTATEDHVATARRLLLDLGWDGGVPEATGQLACRFKETRLQQKQRRTLSDPARSETSISP